MPQTKRLGLFLNGQIRRELKALARLSGAQMATAAESAIHMACQRAMKEPCFKLDLPAWRQTRRRRVYSRVTEDQGENHG